MTKEISKLHQDVIQENNKWFEALHTIETIMKNENLTIKEVTERLNTLHSILNKTK